MEEDHRTGSADSENSSDNSYVQVSKEEVQHVEEEPGVPTEPSPEVTSIPTEIEEEDIYTAGDDDDTPTAVTAPQQVRLVVLKKGNYVIVCRLTF